YSRDWYCDILGLQADGEILHGHLYILPMKGPVLILDSKIYAEDRVFKTPAFHFNTSDIQAAYDYLAAKKVNIMPRIERNWLNFEDPDGNLLM
ncbi:glyoxalase, partial [Escherichia coli]|uniref:VOC family protein n=1 Tax=Escherichia coli TaxID=562 RepID=UPI0022AFCC77